MKKEIELRTDAANQQPDTFERRLRKKDRHGPPQICIAYRCHRPWLQHCAAACAGWKRLCSASDKITLAYIGVGTQGIKEMLPLLAVPEIHVIAVCDPNKEARGYRDWSVNGLRNEVRKALNKPDWTPGGDNTIPGGRDNGKEIVDAYYASVRPDKAYKGCKAYADARELLEKEKDLDAVKIMTPDHLHGVLAMAAIKRGKHVLMHKPLSNRLAEGKKVIELARSKPSVITHLIPWDSNGSMDTVMSWINAGAIGNSPKCTTGLTVPYGRNTLNCPPISRRFPKALIGTSGLDPRLTGLITPTIRTWSSVVGMTSVAAPWPIWGTTACGRCSMP
jgi:hypothetical protein